jgi:hypothetical protein
MLNELDEYMDKLIEETEKNNSNKRPYLPNPKYHAISMRIYRLKKKISKENKKSRRELINKLKSLNKERRLLKSLIDNPEVVKIKYVRYADD